MGKGVKAMKAMKKTIKKKAVLKSALAMKATKAKTIKKKAVLKSALAMKATKGMKAMKAVKEMADDWGIEGAKDSFSKAWVSEITFCWLHFISFL